MRVIIGSNHVFLYFLFVDYEVETSFMWAIECRCIRKSSKIEIFFFRTAIWTQLWYHASQQTKIIRKYYAFIEERFLCNFLILYFNINLIFTPVIFKSNIFSQRFQKSKAKDVIRRMHLSELPGVQKLAKEDYIVKMYKWMVDMCTKCRIEIKKRECHQQYVDNQSRVFLLIPVNSFIT